MNSLSWAQMCMRFSYGQWQKWIMLLNETRNEDTTFHMETCQSSGCSYVQRDQVLKLSVYFLRGNWCLVLFSQSITLEQSPPYSQKKWFSFRNELCGSLSTGGESNMEMNREQRKASEVESLEVMEVRRFWGIENGDEGDSRRKLRRKKGWEHPH